MTRCVKGRRSGTVANADISPLNNKTAATLEKRGG